MQHSDLMARFGAEVRRRRNDLGISQEELAERAALHRTYVSDVEAGKRNLSLASIQRLTKALGASLGAVFAAVDAVPSGPLPESRTRPAEILLVEDDPQDIKLTLAAFKAAKLANPTQIVHDGEQALDYILRRGTAAARTDRGPDVVLLDLSIPKINGLEVLRRLKADPRTRNIRVIVLTASRKDQHIREALQFGAEAYIVKPVDFQSFSQVAPNLSFRWALLPPLCLE